jgi:hypothetical protein
MKRIAYHCTNDVRGIIFEGIVKPSRMPNVYLFKLETTARRYLLEFHYNNIVKVEYDTRYVESTWKPKWANNEMVIKLMPGRTARYLCVLD